MFVLDAFKKTFLAELECGKIYYQPATEYKAAGIMCNDEYLEYIELFGAQVFELNDDKWLLLCYRRVPGTIVLLFDGDMMINDVNFDIYAQAKIVDYSQVIIYANEEILMTFNMDGELIKS